MNHQDFKSLIFGKRVCLVGALPVAADYLLGFDVIVACHNHELPTLPKIRYFRSVYNEEKYHAPAEYYVINQLDHRLRNEFYLTTPFLPYRYEKSRFYELPFASYAGASPHGCEYEFLNIFYKQIGTNPLLGFIALVHILHNEPKEVHLCGMDLYKDHPDANKYPFQIGTHCITTHFNYLKYLIKCDARITTELRLKERLGLL